MDLLPKQQNGGLLLTLSSIVQHLPDTGPKMSPVQQFGDIVRLEVVITSQAVLRIASAFLGNREVAVRQYYHLQMMVRE